ncbi:hypothetical protein F5Y19DRAFT_475466 [Xylariaceae sp. FL1651]|nr:hypothetical protein F5Y19DRAFT_475466 [Xylariaceae sp. FL1651]
MQTQIETADRPPAYAETVPANGSTNDVIQPTILVLAGQTIHAEAAPCAPLYHLDRGVTSLSRLTSKVTFERVEYAVRTSAANEPSLRDRRRHLFTIERSWTVYNKLPSTCPRFFARAVSKRALGHVGLKKSRLRCAFTALPVNVAGRVEDQGLPAFVENAQPLFALRKKAGRWEWTDMNYEAVAVEDEGDDTHRLIVTAPLPRVAADALAVLWCCRLWEYSAESAEEGQHGMDTIRSKLKMGKNAGANGLSGWVI